MSARVPGPPWSSVGSAPPPGGARAEMAPEVRARRRARARRRTLALLLVAVVALAIVATTSSAFVSGAADSGRNAGGGLRIDVPSAPASALAVPSPHAMPTPVAHTAAWAPVRRRTVARRARPAAACRPRRAATPGGHARTRSLEVARRRRERRGRWGRVRLAVLPNGTRGLGPAVGARRLTRSARTSYGDWALRTATLMRGGRAVLRVPVGVGRAGGGDARGRFYVRNRLTRTEPGLRPGRVRDERALGRPHRLAGRRLHRHPRHRPARAHSRPVSHGASACATTTSAGSLG